MKTCSDDAEKFDGDPSFHRLFNPAMVLSRELGSLFSHYRSPSRTAAALERIERSYVATYPASFTLFFTYLRALQRVNWKVLADQQVLQLFEQFPSRASTSGQMRLYQYSWPLELAAQFQAVWSRAQVVIEPSVSPGGKCCDLFVYANDASLPGEFSRWRDQSGVMRSGVAIECKAVESEDKLRRRLKEASGQLKPYQAGVAAIDVSALVAKVARRAHCLPEFYAAVRNEHVRLHDIVADIARREGLSWKGSIVGVSVRCRLSFEPVRQDGAYPHIQMYEYDQSLGFAYTHDVQVRRNVEEVLGSALVDFSRLLLLPFPDRLLRVKKGTSLYVQVDAGLYVPIVRLARAVPRDGFGLEIVATADEGGPGDVYLSGFEITIDGCPTCPYWTAAPFRFLAHLFRYPGSSSVRMDRQRWGHVKPPVSTWVTPEGADGYNFPIVNTRLIPIRMPQPKPDGR